MLRRRTAINRLVVAELKRLAGELARIRRGTPREEIIDVAGYLYDAEAALWQAIFTLNPGESGDGE